MPVRAGGWQGLKLGQAKAMNGRAMVRMVGGCLGIYLASVAFAADPAAELRVSPHGYGHIDLSKSFDRTYGGYWWTSEDGAICEEGIAMDGRPLVCSSDTMLVVNASTAEAGDIHFVDGDIRRTWVNAGCSTGLHLFSGLCPKDPLVGSWGGYVPVYSRYKPGVFVEDTRRIGQTETFGVRHSVGALTYDTLRAKASTVEVRQTWFVASKWCILDEVQIRNLTDQTDEGVSVAVAMDLRSPVGTNRNQLNWYADFHSGGKAGVPQVPRLSDEEYQRLVKLVQFQAEYREADRCVVAQTGCDVRAAKPHRQQLQQGNDAHHGLASEKEPGAWPTRPACSVTFQRLDSTDSGGAPQGSGRPWVSGQDFGGHA